MWVGLQRYHHLRQRSEIRERLAQRGIRLSEGSVSALCDRFLHLLGCLHRSCAPALRAAMRHGYPLHLDATCEQGRGGLFLCLDGWRGWVLHAVRIRSENAAELQPALQATLDDFGPPLAFVRDLGSAMAKAVAACRTSPTPELVCHFHLLAAVGGRLLVLDFGLSGREIVGLFEPGRLSSFSHSDEPSTAKSFLARDQTMQIRPSTTPSYRQVRMGWQDFPD